MPCVHFGPAVPQRAVESMSAGIESAELNSSPSSVLTGCVTLDKYFNLSGSSTGEELMHQVLLPHGGGAVNATPFEYFHQLYGKTHRWGRGP